MCDTMAWGFAEGPRAVNLHYHKQVILISTVSSLELEACSAFLESEKPIFAESDRKRAGTRKKEGRRKQCVSRG